MFPLRAGVIVKRVAVICSNNRVSPACGGYRGGDGQKYSAESCFPCVRGLSGWRTLKAGGVNVFPLPAGVIDTDTKTGFSLFRVSPACGGYLGYIERVTGE